MSTKTNELKKMLLPPMSQTVNVSYTTLATLTVCPVTPAKDNVNKPKRIRTSYTQTQVNEFEKIFVNNQYPTRTLIDKLSNTFDIPVERMKTWFQNRRSRLKRTRQKITKQNTTMDKQPSVNCFGEGSTAVGCGSDRRLTQWSCGPPTHTPSTNQAYMNCDSKTVYSALYHHPVMTPFEVRLPNREQMAEYFQRSSNHGSHIGNRSCHVKQVCMQLATPTNVGYTFQERINYPYVPQDGRGLPSNNQTGGFSVENSQRVDNMCSHAYNMKTRGVRHTPCSAGVNNYNISGFSDNSKPMYNLLLNVGQLQLSSYHMEVNGNATLYEQTYSGHDYHNDCQLGSNCQSVDATLPSSCFPMQPWHVVNTGHHTLQPQSHSIAYPWQFTHGQDFRSWNINRLLLSSQPYQVDSMQISTDGNTLTTSRFRNEVPISSSSLNFRPVKDLVLPVDNYFNHSSRSFDDNTSTTRTSQDSDIDSLESFGSGPYIDQIDMTANQLSDFSPHGPRSPESFRGDTPHPELWCMD